MIIEQQQNRIIKNGSNQLLKWSTSHLQKVYNIIFPFEEMKCENQSKYLNKSTTQYEVLSALNKSQLTRQRILKQLQQIGMNLAEYDYLSLKDLLIKVDDIMKNTYSIKYLGLNKNQMGIISRRINPLADKQFKIHEDTNQLYSIHKYFYPKPLKTGKKMHQTQKINVDNLESEIKKQFEQNRTIQQKKSKQNENERLKTRMMGSWYSLSKSIKKQWKKEKDDRCNANQIANNIQPKIDPAKSFSRFLKQGILIIRD